MTKIGQNAVIFKGYPFTQDMELQDAAGAALVSVDLVWRVAVDEESAAVLTKESGDGIDVTTISGTYRLTLTAAETALLTGTRYYHELKDDSTDDLLLAGYLSILDTIEA